MNNTTQQTTFWKFLSEHTIEIPIIQRDYAQGRKDKISLRKGFLGDLKKALDRNLPNGENNLKLDFVYGSTENGKLQPLDGQQRLTTLWLLHWYIALRAGKLEEAAPVLSKFTYETRISSREFCKQLCTPENFKSSGLTYKIVPYITNQTWFFSAWKQDPTIQAMLTMLSGTPDKAKDGNDIIDGIEEAFTCEGCLPNRFCKYVFYWNKLTSDDCPIIFYYLDLLGLKLSDDLYIKMNARGKQLTSFENFKADLIKYINEKKESSLTDEEKNKWNTLLNSKEGLPIKMDTTWMDIFWKNKSEDFKVDDIYFAFLNRFFWNELFILKRNVNDEYEYVLKVGQGKINDGGSKKVTNTIELTNKYYSYLNQDDVDAYSNFDLYKFDDGEIPLELFNKLQLVLNRLDKFYALNGSIPECSWDKNFHFIPQYTENGISKLNQQYRIVFFAVCKYLEEGEADESSLKRWMRVVWNLVSGEDEKGQSEIRSTSAMRTAIEFISKLESHNVYESLSKLEVTGNSVYDERCKEEIAKAERILSCKRCLKCSWENAIMEAESHAFFKGAIRFLFRDENGNVKWNDFDTKWENAREYFDKDKSIVLVELTKYCSDKEIECFFQKWSFSEKNWAKILQDNLTLKSVHNFLMKTNKATELTLLQKDLQNLLPKTGNDVWLLKKWLDCEWVLTNYSQRRSEPFNGWVYEVNNSNRTKFNKFLNSLPDDSVCGPEAWRKNFVVNDGTAYYKGLWTDFKYKNTNFRYSGDIIYLMDENWNKVIKGAKKDEYFCFKANSTQFNISLYQLIGQKSGYDMIVLINNHLYNQ